MKQAIRNAVLLSALGLSSVGAFAGSCDLSVTRVACAGKEAVSYKKCDGQASCVEKESAPDAAACKVMAVEACGNKRLDITKSKVITAKFDGKEIKTDAGDADFCKAYPNRSKEFDKCS